MRVFSCLTQSSELMQSEKSWKKVPFSTRVWKTPERPGIIERNQKEPGIMESHGIFSLHNLFFYLQSNFNTKPLGIAQSLLQAYH